MKYRIAQGVADANKYETVQDAIEHAKELVKVYGESIEIVQVIATTHPISEVVETFTEYEPYIESAGSGCVKEQYLNQASAQGVQRATSF